MILCAFSLEGEWNGFHITKYLDKSPLEVPHFQRAVRVPEGIGRLGGGVNFFFSFPQ